MKEFLFGIGMLVTLWAVASYGGLASETVLASPHDTFSRVSDLPSDETIGKDVLSTFWRWGAGYLIGALIGIPLGLLMGLSKHAQVLLTFPIEFLRSLPVTAAFPLFLLVWGIEDASKIAMVAFATVFIVTINTAYGAMDVSVERKRMAKLFNASKFEALINIIIPASLGHIAAGLRLALGSSLIVVIVSEMFVGTQFGIGKRLYDAYSINDVSSLYAFLLLTGFMGYFLNKLFMVIERRSLFWLKR